jgi:exodeoxyribonuclease VII large subunit
MDAPSALTVASDSSAAAASSMTGDSVLDASISLAPHPVMTVGEVSRQLKQRIETAYRFLRVRGEISGLKIAPSGHAYFSIKDEAAVLSAVCWKGSIRQAQAYLNDGLEVICTGGLTTYMGQSKYQMVVQSIEPAGAGALMALLDARRKLLQAEGLFDASRRRPLPAFPRKIGIVTSLGGAVLRDMVHRLTERFPLSVMVWPVLVQGDQAAGQITTAIEGFSHAVTHHGVRLDLMIVARGGGSIEDLWAFNEESVVRAAARASVPVISAVGHETDTTLIDLACHRAPTPTAAAEMAVPDRRVLRHQLGQLGTRLTDSIDRQVVLLSTRLRALTASWPSPDRVWGPLAQRLDHLGDRLIESMARRMDRARGQLESFRHAWDGQSLGWQWERQYQRWQRASEMQDRAMATIVEQVSGRLARASDLLIAYSYEDVLRRGYSFLRDAGTGEVVSRVSQVRVGTRLEARVTDGWLALEVADAMPETVTGERP